MARLTVAAFAGRGGSLSLPGTLARPAKERCRNGVALKNDRFPFIFQAWKFAGNVTCAA